jgi:hypothetical protein
MRRQLTHLPEPVTLPGSIGGYPLLVHAFITNDTVAFFNLVSVPGAAEPRPIPFTVKTDGGEPEAVPLPQVFAGSRIDPTFAVIGARFVTAVLPVPEGGADLFLFRRGGDVLQLTNLHSHDLDRRTNLAGVPLHHAEDPLE